MKSNPYVYPYVPFKDLSNKNFISKFSKAEKFTINELKELLVKMPHLDKNPVGRSIAEKIFNLFVDDEVRFGPKEFLEENKETWLEKFNYFISKNEPLQMTILGFPFKMPVPIKTNRLSPDLGEVMSLMRLREITDIIKNIYQPGAVLFVVTEGVFGRFNEMEEKEYDDYKEFLDKLVEELGWSDSLKVIELESMELLTDDFSTMFNEKVKTFQERFENGDEEFLKKYNGAKPSIEKIINVRDTKISKELIMDVYNTNLIDVNDDVKNIREEISKKTHDTLIKYFAYLSVRDDLDFIEKTVPHAITLSVSPKPNRLGVIPVNNNVIRLPYHGVPVVHNDGSFSIEYFIDLEREGGTYTPMYLDIDNDNSQFYFVENE